MKSAYSALIRQRIETDKTESEEFLLRMKSLMNKQFKMSKMNLDTQHLLELRLCEWKKTLATTKSKMERYKNDLEKLKRGFHSATQQRSLSEFVRITKEQDFETTKLSTYINILQQQTEELISQNSAYSFCIKMS